jgi:hypothetical protein
MCIAHRLIAGLSIAVLSVLCPASGFGQSSADTRGVTAIDILLDPDAIMVEHAQAANARLLVDNPKGFALDAAHAPHITVLQQFVRTDELDKVYAAVAKVSEEEQPNA